MNDRQQLENLVKLGNRFRNCPIVDDDFPHLRDTFDFALTDATNHLADKDRTKIVCLCGSTRFKQQFQEHNLKETLAGKIVLSVGCYMHSDPELGITDEQKKKLDELHLRKIDLADEVLILNVGGYIGESTRRELQYAERQGKKICFLEPV